MKEFIKKLIRFREHTLKKGVCGKNVMRAHKALKAFKNYLEFYPNVSDEALKKYCHKHQEELMVLMPGKSSNCHEKFTNELTKYLSL